MHKLTMTNEQGEIVILDFDSLKNTLTFDGVSAIRPNLTQAPPSSNRPTLIKVKPAVPGLKTAKVKTLKIQLGLKCNYSCSYCSQASTAGGAEITNNRDAEEFIANLDSWLIGDPQKIELWGGEPLIYIKKLRYLVPRLRSRFPNVLLTMITNGSLMNDSIIDFILENDISVAISHDAKGQSLRGEDPFDDPVTLKAIKRLADIRGEELGINSVITKGNLDMEETVRHFKSILGDKVSVNFEDVVNFHDDEAIESNHLTDDDLSTLTDNVFYGILAGNLGESPSVSGTLDRFIDSLRDGVDMEKVSSKCGMDMPDMVACDLKGNITTCQNVGTAGDHKVGSVYDIENARLVSSTHFSHRKNCLDCPVLSLCGGGCMYSYGEHFEASCKAQFAYNMGYLKAVLHYLTGFVLTKITTEKRESGLIPIFSL